MLSIFPKEFYYVLISSLLKHGKYNNQKLPANISFLIRIMYFYNNKQFPNIRSNY